MSSLSRNLSVQQFNQHIKPLSLQKVTDGTAHFHCQSISLDWLENRLKQQILDAIPDECGIVDVAFEVAESKPVNGHGGEVEAVIPESIQAEVEDDSFGGFEMPEENWSKLPHSLIAELPRIKGEAELKIILYILRHTWGYQDDQKKITINEFMNGRKTRNPDAACKYVECQEKGIDNRIDHGTGMTKRSVTKGIKKAKDQGFINVEIDTSDKARTQKYYSLNYRS